MAIHPDKVFLNGHWLAADEARVSVFDRGFVFGDGVYEVIPVYGKRPFRLNQHLDRLKQSLGAIHLPNPHTDQEWAQIIQQLIEQNEKPDQMIYFQVTRGAAPRDHAFPANVIPTVFAYGKPLHYATASEISKGVSAITADDVRWLRCDIKSIALLGNVILRQNAIEKGAAEAILVRDGLLTEGAASNIFIVKNNTIVTPPKGALILPGVTRDLVVELARKNGVACEERSVTSEEVFAADEVWLTSSTKEILPIVRVDEKTIGNGKPGAMHEKMFTIYQDYKDSFRKGEVD